jgi:hypothetical protein
LRSIGEKCHEQERRPDYTAVLSDLRNRRAQLDAAIQALEAVVGSAGRCSPLAGAAGTAAGHARRLPKSFVGLSVLDAAKQHLQRTGHSLRTTEILGALQQGGVALTGKSPINSLGAILNSNLKKDAGIVQRTARCVGACRMARPRPEAMNGSLA